MRLFRTLRLTLLAFFLVGLSYGGSAEALSIIAENTGGQAHPAIAPGGVAFMRSDGQGQVVYFQALQPDGAPFGNPIMVNGTDWIQAGALAALGNDYILAGGTDKLVLSQINPFQGVMKQIALDQGGPFRDATVKVLDDIAWVSWTNQVLNSVRICRVDLSDWTVKGPHSINPANEYSQDPRLEVLPSGALIGFAGSSKTGSSPLQCGWSVVDDNCKSVWKEFIRPIDKGRSYPAGLVAADGVFAMLLVNVGQTGAESLCLQGSKGMQTLMPQVSILYRDNIATATSRIGSVIVINEGRKLIEMVKLGPSGRILATPQIVSDPRRRCRNPAVALSGNQIWLAWDRFGQQPGATVMVHRMKF